MKNNYINYELQKYLSQSEWEEYVRKIIIEKEKEEKLRFFRDEMIEEYNTDVEVGGDFNEDLK